jgi:hypothetical protein
MTSLLNVPTKCPIRTLSKRSEQRRQQQSKRPAQAQQQQQQQDLFITILPTKTDIQQPSFIKLSDRWEYYMSPAVNKRSFRKVGWTVIVMAMFLFRWYDFRWVIRIPPEQQFNTFHDKPVEQHTTDHSEDDPVILIHWNHWKDFERIVDSIWSGNLFCKTLQSEIHRKAVAKTSHNSMMNSFSPLPTVHVHIEISCLDLFQNSRHGTGNYIQAIYMMRLAVRYISSVNIKLNVTCVDAEQLQHEYILPWFTGTWYSPSYFNSTNGTVEVPPNFANQQGPAQPSLSTVSLPQESLRKGLYCALFIFNPTAIMYEEMIYDVRRMAIALVGISSLPKNHIHSAEIERFVRQNIYSIGTLRRRYQRYINNEPSQDVFLSAGNQQERLNASTNIMPLIQPPQQQAPLELDDAVIHFRCGDLLSTNLKSYGFMTFDGYSRHVSPHARTIGILTQPFHPTPNTDPTASTASSIAQARRLDTANVQITQRCQIMVLAFVQHLQERFPNATIHVRNGPSETIAMAYARIVMANQSIGAMSTFSVFPILGTFGTGYYLRPKRKDPSMWLIHGQYPITEMDPNNASNLVLFDESNLLLGSHAKALWHQHGEDVVLQWFRTGSYSLENLTKIKHPVKQRLCWNIYVTKICIG